MRIHDIGIIKGGKDEKERMSTRLVERQERGEKRKEGEEKEMHEVDVQVCICQNTADRPFLECRLLNLFLPLTDSASLGCGLTRVALEDC